MLRKLTVLLIAALFSLSVSGLGFAAEEKKQGATPATPATPAKPAANPCDLSKKTKKPTKAQKLAKQKAACLEKATTDQDKAECEKKFAEKAKRAKKAKKDEGATMAPEKPAAPAEKK